MIDVKEWLQAAAATLATGEVVKPETLTYLDAMNALEMMDPAMDEGCQFAPKGRFNPSATLSAAQLCWIMDGMAARELAWHRGGTMAQTLFTSLHYHNALTVFPSIPSEDPSFPMTEASCAAMRAYVLSYAKAIEIAYSSLYDGSGAARDGEDVWLDAYGVPIETTETVDMVIDYVDNVLEFISVLAAYDPMWAQVVMRLRWRREWVTILHESQGHLHVLVGMNITPAPEEAAVDWAFDDVSPLLRQSMPLPSVTLPARDEVWGTLAETALAMCRYYPGTHILQPGLALLELEQEVQARGDLLPIVRALYRTVINDTPNRDDLVEEWFMRVGPDSQSGILRNLDSIITGASDRRSFALWRDIVGGALLMTLQAPLGNPCRQRRGLERCAETWSDQAAVATRLSASYPAFNSLVHALHARALDCQLESSLLAFDLRLIGYAEHRMAWWWVLVLARARANMPLRDTLESGWARAWAAVASAMLLLYSLIPPPHSDPTPTVEQFILRHKVPLKTRAPPLFPSFLGWDAARQALDGKVETSATCMPEKACEWLRDARDRFADPAIGGRGRRTEPLIGAIKSNLALLEGADEQRIKALAWEGKAGTSRLPRLVEKDADAGDKKE